HMSPAKLAPIITDEADFILHDSRVLQNDYLLALAARQLSLDEFRRSQEQFYFAVLHFARPMAALLARLPHPRNRIDILHNLVEEHGDFHAAKFHEATFRSFLESIGANGDPLENVEVEPAVDAFNRTLDGICFAGDVNEAVACMGIIEYAFADISAAIGNAVSDNGWVRKDELVHYSLHAEIDKRHAREFFDVVEDEWNANPASVRRGMRLGAHVFRRLYDDLFAACTACSER
ncbi:MAG: iron-containing redox enzyme family protein, partial [Planctomycetota bacterium]